MKFFVKMCLVLFVATAALWCGAPRAEDDPVHAFFLAVQFDDASAVRKAINKLGPNLQDPQRGEPGLIVALRENAMRAFHELLAAPKIEVDLAARNGNTALMMAAYLSNRPALDALLAKGATVNRNGWTPLHYAAAGGDADIVRLLAKRGAKLNARSPTFITPLMLAAREGKEDTVAALLALGADATLKNGEELTAAQIAARADKPAIAATIDAHLAPRKNGK